MNYEEEILNLKKRIAELEKLIVGEKQNIEPLNKSQMQNRDKTKYMFEGKVYAKNRLVLAVIRDYVYRHIPTFAELCRVFDKSLQGSLGVVKRYEEAQEISDAAKRFFMKEEDVLVLKDGRVVVCTQWGIFNIVKFIKQAQLLGYNVDVI